MDAWGLPAPVCRKGPLLQGPLPCAGRRGHGGGCGLPGEIYTALAGGFPAEKLYFHGNNKTDEDIAYALDCGVGCFIVDNHQELERLEQAAGARSHRQRVLLRVTPGIDPHTLQAINTGRIDCQFGVPIETGQAAQFVADALSRPHLQVEGFHSHIGSQIFEAAPFCDAVDILLDFAHAMRQAHGFVARTLNLGGGFGVRYRESDPTVDIPGNIRALADHLRRGCETKGYPMPRVLLEPGRSIVANAGLTLYRVGGVKTIAGYRSYVTVNGGMTDNPRYALYQAPYTVLPASRMGETRDFLCTVAGRCCESGDLIQEKVSLPQPARDDLLAVLTTGAYNFTMASNYNRLCRPALVMVRGARPGWRSAGRPLRTWWPATCKGSARTGGKKAMEIRRAALADIPGVCACCVAAFKDYIPLIGQTPGPMLEDYCQARKEHFLFVAAQGRSFWATFSSRMEMGRSCGWMFWPPGPRGPAWGEDSWTIARPSSVPGVKRNAVSIPMSSISGPWKFTANEAM